MRERKAKKIRYPHKIILVICEGETEKNYVETLRWHYRLPITIKSKVMGNKINNRLVSQFVKELSPDNPADVILFYMYDADVDVIVEKLKKLTGTPLISNPCIELWYLLHGRIHSRAINSKEALSCLISSEPWKEYKKGELNSTQKQFLLANKGIASTRAKELKESHNPSTNIYLLLDILDKMKS